MRHRHYRIHAPQHDWKDTHEGVCNIRNTDTQERRAGNRATMSKRRETDNTDNSLQLPLHITVGRASFNSLLSQPVSSNAGPATAQQLCRVHPKLNSQPGPPGPSLRVDLLTKHSSRATRSVALLKRETALNFSQCPRIPPPPHRLPPHPPPKS